MKKKIEELYLDFVNYFLTVKSFAEHYNVSEIKAKRIINLGKKLHERRFSNERQK